MRKPITRIHLRLVDTDPKHGEFCARYDPSLTLNANVVIGESTTTAAPFFEGAERRSRPFWGPHQGRKLILWESLGPENQLKCLIELRDDANWVRWCKAKPKDMFTQHSESTVGASSKVNVRSQTRLMIIKKTSRETGMLSEPEVGGNGEM